MAKKEEVLKITEEELKSLQEVINALNGATNRVGQLDAQKHLVHHDIMRMRGDLNKIQGEMETEYGKVNINIENGTITPREDVEADTKD